MTNFIDMDSGSEIRRCLGTITSGSLMSVSEVPNQVRIFSATSPNGDLTTEYSYADGTVELDTPLDVGEVAKAYSDGDFFFETVVFVKNVETERTLTNTLRIINENYNVKNLVLNLATLGFTSDVIEWNTGSAWSSTFPITVPSILKNTNHDIQFRITIDGTEATSNFRDISITASYREEGDE